MDKMLVYENDNLMIYSINNEPIAGNRIAWEVTKVLGNFKYVKPAGYFDRLNRLFRGEEEYKPKFNVIVFDNNLLIFVEVVDRNYTLPPGFAEQLKIFLKEEVFSIDIDSGLYVVYI